MRPIVKLRFRAAAALLLALLGLAAPTLGSAQRLEGRVVNGERAVADVPVELHRVTRGAAGVVGQGSTGPDGGFAFDLPPADSSGFSVLFATAVYQGVRYFGSPLHSSEPLSGYTVQVYDTVAVTAATAGVRVARRDMILFPDADGGAEVDEIIQLHNPHARTLVSASGMPIWEFRLPEGVGAFEVGEGQISPENVRQMGDRVLLTGSLPPGRQELFVRYRLRRGATRTVLPLAPGTDSMNLLVRQPSAALRVSGLTGPAVVEAEAEAEKEKFLRFTGAGLQRTPSVVLAWDRSDLPPVDPRWAAVGVTGLLLAAGAGVAARRRPGAERR